MQVENMIELFFAAEKKFPQALALSAKSKSLTYAELKLAVEQRAESLKSLGVNKNQHIAILLERDCELVITLLAILALGATYIPLDKRYPTDKIKHILSAAQADFLVTDAAMDLACATIALSALQKNDKPIAQFEMATTEVAYIIFTSGTTGQPKGIQISHANALSLINWASKQFTQHELAFTLASTSIAFDLSIFEIFTPLAVGGCVCLIDSILDLAVENIFPSLTLINTVPSAAQTLLSMNAIPDSVKVINLAGEALSQQLANELYEKTSATKIYNLYGPSETTTYSTGYLAQANAAHRMVPIGFPIDGTHVLLLDQDELPVPKLARGEIYIGGLGVSLGYCNTELNASKFKIINHKRYYQTGDLARINHQGELEYLGRMDNQIKLRGFRIELDEIIHHIKTLGFENTVVIKDEAIVAYVVCSQDNITMIEKTLKSKLPEYMLPAHYIALQTLPLTFNGKIDKNALPHPEHHMQQASLQTDTEFKLAQLWSALLPIKEINPQTNFFHSGGHSLLAARLVHQIEKDLKIKISLSDIFAHPTLQQQALLMEKANPQIASHFNSGQRPAALPLSFNQKRLWYLQYAQTNVPISNIPIVVHIEGELDVPVLEKSLVNIIQRHEILRTTYHSEDYNLVQVVHEQFKFKIEMVWAEHENDIQAQLKSLANKPFDLSQDLMLRATLFVLPANHYVLLINQHHIASDAWSMNNLIVELQQFYHGFKNNKPVQLLPVIQYADFCCWQKLNVTTDSLKPSIAYWKKQLADAPQYLQLPVDSLRQADGNTQPLPVANAFDENYAGEFHHFVLSESFTHSLKQFANEHSLSLFMLLYAGFALLLNRYTHQNDFCIGVISGQRPHADLDHSLGFFVNTLVIRNQFNPQTSTLNYLHATKDLLLNALAHQDLPFDKLVDELQPSREHQHPFFNILFSLQNALDNELQLEQLKLSTKEFDRGISKFDLTLSIVEKQHSMHAILEYRTKLFSAATMARMAKHYESLLTSMMDGVNDHVRELNMLSAQEYALLHSINQTHTLPQTMPTLSDWFDEVATRHPQKNAVISDEIYTYHHLKTRANQLAHKLMAYRFAPETAIGILLHRSCDWLTAMLAITKTGATYVPLNPEWPTERLAHIIQDAKVGLVISTVNDAGNLPQQRNFTTLFLNQFDFNQFAPEFNNQSCDANRAAYIMYTSGSTGLPKGVVVEEKSIARLVFKPNYILLNADTILLQVSPLEFDAATFDIWGTLLNAGTLVLMPGGVPSFDQIAARIEAHQVNTLFVTTQLFNSLIDMKINVLASLQYLLFGGEVASLHHVKQFKEKYPHCEIHNIYGPTECTTFALHYPIENNFDATQPLPLGKPISDTAAVILSEENLILPVGLAGEICLAGPGLARQYLNQPELTDEKFIKNTFSEINSTRIYRTGDKAFYRADGNIVYLGRFDNQVKLRGHRIELSEIEKVLRQFQPVRDAVVVLQKPEDLLIAYCITQCSEDEIKQFLNRQLPHYMVPDAIMILDQFILNANGKIDKELLPKWQLQRKVKIETQAKGQHDVANVIRDIWVKVLEDDEVTYDENFFDIGGNSLKIIHVLDYLQAHFKEQEDIFNKLDITALFQYPSIEALSDYLTEGIA